MLEKHPSIWSAIYRRDFLTENNIRFPEYPGSGWADNPFLIDTLITANSIIYLDEPYYHYRVDLPGATLNHKTDELIALPFERWRGMTSQLHEKGVSDEGVWKAHYKRGFDYIHGAIVDDGWENEIVQEKTKQVFDMMKPEIVYNLETHYPELKLLYAELEGGSAKYTKFSAKQMKFYVKETCVRVKQRGVRDSLQIVKREIKRRTRLLRKPTLKTKMCDIHEEALRASSREH